MLVLGVDPGLAIVGFGLVDYSTPNKFEVIDYGTINTSKDLTVSQRLLLIFEQFNNLLEKYHPEQIAIEKLFFNTNVTTAMSVSQARGVVLLAAEMHKTETFEYTPLQVKQSVVGYGKSDKRQVQEMVKNILKLDKIPKPDDAADALAIAICHCHSYNSIKRYLYK